MDKRRAGLDREIEEASRRWLTDIGSPDVAWGFHIIYLIYVYLFEIMIGILVLIVSEAITEFVIMMKAALVGTVFGFKEPRKRIFGERLMVFLFAFFIIAHGCLGILAPDLLELIFRENVERICRGGARLDGLALPERAGQVQSVHGI